METWNPWHGCRKYSEGCENCYMSYLDAKRGLDGYDIYKVKGNFDLPVKRDRKGSYKVKSGSTLHVCLTSDFFLEEADEWRDDAWKMIRERSDVRFMILTKRAERIPDHLQDDWGEGYPNVALRVTAENQRRADERIPLLLSVPSGHKGIMTAPLLGEIHIEKYLATGMIEYVIADGENYEGARPCRYEWVKGLYDQCRKYGVTFEFAGTGNVFVKDGKTYNICKAYQHVEALRSGLFWPPRGGSLPRVMKKCASCKIKDSCSGCRRCGKCREMKVNE